MTKAEMFVNELIDYIFAYPDEDWMSMEVLCRKLYKHGLISKKDGEWIGEYLNHDERKTEPNSSEKPNNCEKTDCETCLYAGECDWKQWQKCYSQSVRSNLESFRVDEPQTDYTPDCPFCIRYGTEDCLGSDCRHYKTYKDEPQTERSE